VLRLAPIWKSLGRGMRALGRMPLVWTVLVYIVALLPCGLLVFLHEPVTPGVAITYVVLSVAIVGFGTALWLNPHLWRLGLAVDAWRSGNSFDAQSFRKSHRDVRRLAVSFKRATLALDRHEAQLQAAITEQDLLMQEIHHRVKNNLQIVASMLNLQASRIRLPEAKAEFQSARDRVRALATLHRHLYAHGEVHTIDMREFLVELCGQLFQAMGETPGKRLQLHIDAIELKMSSDQAVPMALIVTEAVSNAVKYAFPAGRHGSVWVRLNTDGETAELQVRDDGVGIPAGRVETEAGTRDGIGLQLIRGFSRQLGATLDVQEGNGTEYLVRMPLRKERIASPVFRAAPARASS
jgi:two-component sensor histidine kinase